MLHWYTKTSVMLYSLSFSVKSIHNRIIGQFWKTIKMSFWCESFFGQDDKWNTATFDKRYQNCCVSCTTIQFHNAYLFNYILLSLYICILYSCSFSCYCVFYNIHLFRIYICIWIVNLFYLLKGFSFIGVFSITLSKISFPFSCNL